MVTVIHDWAEKNEIQILNVVGPRESKVPGIYDIAKNVLSKVIE